MTNIYEGVAYLVNVPEISFFIGNFQEFCIDRCFLRICKEDVFSGTPLNDSS